MNNLELFRNFFKSLPQFEISIEPFAKKANVTSKEAVVLLALFYSDEYEMSFDENLKNQLIEKNLLEYNDKRLCLTGKGSIIAKSIISNLNRF